MRFFIFFTTALLTGITGIRAQEPCLTDLIARQNRHRIPAATRPHPSPAPLPRGAGEVYYIPVVVHVVYKGNIENISNTQIISQIDVLNEDFRKLNPDVDDIPAEYASLAADFEIQFCLAQIDPDGNASNGITRTSTNYSNIGQQYTANGTPRLFYSALGGADAWDPEHYLNIWVAGIGDGILGFASYPDSAPPEEDGVVVDPRYFGRTGLTTFYPPHDKGRTATHEIGHYFNLLHIWGDNISSCTDDDEIDDTPFQRDPYLGCPTFPQLSCGNKAMFMNYMDYTDDACMFMFTEGQKARARAALLNYRPGLLESAGCNSTPANETTVVTALRISPNPVENQLFVQHEGWEAGQWFLIDVWGRSTMIAASSGPENGRQEFNVGFLPAGIYWLEWRGKQAVSRKKFVKL